MRSLFVLTTILLSLSEAASAESAIRGANVHKESNNVSIDDATATDSRRNLRKALLGPLSFVHSLKKSEQKDFYDGSSDTKFHSSRRGLSSIDECEEINPVSVSSYEMKNGGLTYTDSSYPGGPYVNYELLSGGKGELADGFIATNSWPDVQDVPKYVGWDFRQVFQDTKKIPITFFFDQDVTITKLEISVDDPVLNNGGIKAPSEASIGETVYEVGGVEAGPYTKTIELDAPITVATGVGFEIELLQDVSNNCLATGVTTIPCPWIFVSEIQLFGCLGEESSSSSGDP